MCANCVKKRIVGPLFRKLYHNEAKAEAKAKAHCGNTLNAYECECDLSMVKNLIVRTVMNMDLNRISSSGYYTTHQSSL